MTKKTFIVLVREVHVQPYRVEAETPQEAIQVVAGAGGEVLENRLEYSHTLDTDLWTVEEGFE